MFINIVLAGGGIKAVKVLGGLQYMEEHGYLSLLRGYYGTSSGAIICLLLVLGYKVKQIIEIFDQLVDSKLFSLNLDIDQLLDRYFLYDTSRFDKLLRTLIGCKLSFKNPSSKKDITALELYQITGKVLTVATININTGLIVYANHENFPNIPVYKLVKMSCAIPILFEPVIWEGNMYIDGGLLDNYPIEAVPKHELYLTTGIKIKTIISTTDISNGDITSYVGRLASISMSSVGNVKTSNAYYVTVNESLNKDIINTKINPEQKKAMILEGYEELERQVLGARPKRRNSFTS